jgi:hypothetical protein
MRIIFVAALHIVLIVHFQSSLFAESNLLVTPRSNLRTVCGVNTHFNWENTAYSEKKAPRQKVIEALRQLGVGMIRERFAPGNSPQKQAFDALAEAGIKFYITIGTIRSTPQEVQSDIEALAKSDIAPSVIAICGPNEVNASGNAVWPEKAVAVQKIIFDEVSRYPTLKHAFVVGPVLKHNVRHLDDDYKALCAAGIQQYCNRGDFHFYPGNWGPAGDSKHPGNVEECTRATQAYGKLIMFNSETGWTLHQTDPEMAGRFSVEAYLRNYLHGLCGTFLYEFIDEGQTKGKHEGYFGLLKEDCTPKPAYSMVQSLLATKDGSEAFPGHLAVGDDAQTVVTSEGNGHWTVYLLRSEKTNASVLLPAGYECDGGSSVHLANSLTIIHVNKK